MNLDTSKKQVGTLQNLSPTPLMVPYKKAWLGLSKADVEGLCVLLGRSKVHAHRLFKLTYTQLERPAWQDPSVPADLRQLIDDGFHDARPQIVRWQQSGYDQSIKFILELEDGYEIECVLMPESKRLTLCVSSQVGCRQGCRFCETGRMGLLRNLSTAEIVGQVQTINDWLRQNPLDSMGAHMQVPDKITNVVFMGMGEPLDNVEQVVKALDIFCDHSGMQMSLKRLSVSTAGHLDGLKEALRLNPKISLALSVHSPFEEERSQLMPINQKWPLREVIDYLKNHPVQQKQCIFIQYTVLAHKNDSESHALTLIDLLQGLSVKINLIPYNQQKRSTFVSPEYERVEAFRKVLQQSGLRVMVRYSKGQDIGAGCGQLIKKQLRKAPLDSTVVAECKTC